MTQSLALDAVHIPGESSQRLCPACGATVPVDMGFVPWCDKCGWNVAPADQRPASGRLEQLYLALGKRSGRQIFEEVRTADSSRPHLSVPALTAFALAGMVHLVSLASILLALWLLFSTRLNPFAILAAVVLGGMAFLAIPRPAPAPRGLVARDTFPVLYALADRIGGELGLGAIDSLAVDAAFNASLRRYGWRFRRCFTLGLPFLSVLAPEERVAVVAHEVAHAVNGDFTRVVFFSWALGTLGGWYASLYPTRIFESEMGGLAGLASIPANVVRWCLANVVFMVASALAILTWRDRQRAEYLADRLAARVAGTDAMLSMLEKVNLERTIQTTVRRAALNSSADLFEDIRHRAATLPPREWERIRRVNQLEDSRLDATHPPTALRIDQLRAHPVPQPAIRLSAAEIAALEAELATLEKPIARELTSACLASLYR